MNTCAVDVRNLQTKHTIARRNNQQPKQYNAESVHLILHPVWGHCESGRVDIVPPMEHAIPQAPKHQTRTPQAD